MVLEALRENTLTLIQRGKVEEAKKNLSTLKGLHKRHSRFVEEGKKNYFVDALKDAIDTIESRL
jgi:C4-dicarboxylate-specific signal transduction histidine kinase